MTIFFDLTKQTPEEIVAALSRMCQEAATDGKISDNVIPLPLVTFKDET